VYVASGPAAASLTDRDKGGKMKYCATCKTVYPADFQCCPKDGSALSSSSELLPGMVIRDKYQILQQIGSGGMATVYQVRHLAFNEIRAIKLINSQLADGDQFSKRLRSEAVIARKLQHPNAVHVDDLDRTEDGRPFIVMEYVEGQNLRTVIRQEGPLPVLRALRIAVQVTSALAAAHKLGIIHRDIKPDNIHLISQPDGSDFVKVLDFGIAKFTHDLSSSAPRTGSGLIVGTPQYVSPEQAMGRQTGELDGRSDLYTLGIVLYEMLTGRVPFDSDTPVGLLVHHLHTAPIPPDELRPDLAIPHAVSEVLMKALEKNPERRFRNADEMLNAISSVEEHVRQLQETGTVETLEKDPEQHFSHAHEMPSATASGEEHFGLVQDTGPTLMKTPEKNPERRFPDADEMLRATSSAEEQVQGVQGTGTAVPSAELGLETAQPPITDRIPLAYDTRVESTSVQDATANWVAPPNPPTRPMWPNEAPRSRDIREELLAAAYEAPTSRRMLYAGIAFAVVCLAAFGIYQRRSASAKPAEQPAHELHDPSLPAAGRSTRPATEAAQSLPDSATQRSDAAPHSASAPVAKASASPSDLGKQEKLAKIKELVSQGRMLSDSGEYTAAIDRFESALTLDPKSAEAKAGKRRAQERMQLEQALPNEDK
jgi:serine/threonine protein kinase